MQWTVRLEVRASQTEVKTTEPVPISQRWASSLPQIFAAPLAILRRRKQNSAFTSRRQVRHER
jgi:hypothetical protein